MNHRYAVACGLLCVAGTFACNAILGIDAATREADAGAPDSTTTNDAPSDQSDAGALADSSASSDSAAPLDGTAPDDAADDALEYDVAVRDGAADVSPSYEVSCANYCNLIQAACTGDNIEYLNATVCAQFCGIFEASSEVLTRGMEPTEADNLNCRVWHANAALIASPQVHCPHAGPLGGMVCNANMGADPCVPFCTMDLTFCKGANAVYDSVSDCLSACRGVGDAGGYPYENTAFAPPNDIASQFDNGSNTLNCRLYHLENVVLSQRPDVHCPHTSRSGGGVCVDSDN